MKTPWHIWVVGVVTLLWHGFGAYDYLMSATRNAAYFEMIPEDQRPGMLAYLDGMPVWAVSTWALGVWGSVVGSLLILLRSRHAVAAFVLSLIGLIGTSLYTYVLAPVPAMSRMNSVAMIITLTIVVVLLATLFYARRQVALGNLR